MAEQLTLDARLTALERDAARLARLERVADLERQLEAILDELQGCADPEREAALNVELRMALDAHQAAVRG